jgi:hypothetical protein
MYYLYVIWNEILYINNMLDCRHTIPHSHNRLILNKSCSSCLDT